MPKYLELPDDFDMEALGEFKDKVKPFEPEDVTGLKNNANKILSEKKALEAQLAEMQAELKKSKAPAGDEKDKDKIEAQLQDAITQLETQKKEYDALQKSVKQKDLHSKAIEIASQLTKDTRRANLLAEKIGSRIDIDNGNIVVLDQNGSPTVSTVNDLTSYIKKEYDFLCDGSQASGGGAKGGGGGPAEAKTMSRSDFEKLGHNDRHKFFADGGSLIDE